MNIRRISHTARSLVVLVWLLGLQLTGQPVCSIDIGPDQTICEGGSVTLQGPPGYGSYLWSNGASTQDITVSTAGDHWCEVSYPSGNMVTNGNFSAGNTGFSSQYYYSPTSVQNEGYYTVGSNASWYHNQFQGTGTGNFLIGNGGYLSWANNQYDVWCQTITCCPGQTYTLSFWARTLTNAIPARAVWMMDGVLAQWPDMTFPAFSAGWQEFNTTWTAGPGQTSVAACIHITSADGVGNDFGIDDISISGTIVLRDEVHVTVTPLPIVDLGADQTLCAGETLDLDATVPGGTYLWQDGSTDPTVQVSTAGDYSVTVTAQNCSSTDQVSIAYDPLPFVDLGADTLLCAGSTLTLSAFSPGYGYLWQDGSSASSFTVNAPGTYWVEVTRNNCTARDSIVVGYKPMPAVFLGNDTAICADASLLLDATFPGATYLWQDGSTDPSLSVLSAGNYQVTVDLNGCSAQDAILVTEKPLPEIDLGPNLTVCPGASATFDATTAGATYLWSDGSSGATLTTDQPGNYSVQVTVNGCSASDAAALANFNLQTVDLGPDRTICAGETTTVGMSVPGATYSWNTGAVTDSISVSSAGTYWVDAILNGCAVRDSINVQEIPLPVVSLGPDLQVCPGGTETLDATTAGGSYLWSNGATSPTITVGVGTWSVDVTVNGCTGSDAATITELTPPFVNLGPDTLLCPGETLLLDVGSIGASYLWSSGATGPSITVTSAGTVSVTVTDAQSCTASDAITVSFADPGSISLGPDISFCTGDHVTLDASVAGANSYAWSDGTWGPVLSTSVGGTYWVQITQGNCLIGDTIELYAVPSPSITLGNDTTLCPGETWELQVPATGLDLEWQDGSQGSSFVVDAAGEYRVIATNAAGCSDTATVQVSFMGANAFNLGNDTLICAGSSLILDAGLPGGTTQWTGTSNASTPYIPVNTTGTYVATTTVAGCAFTDSIHVSVIAPPVLDLGPDINLCTGSTIELSVNAPSVLWDDGSTAAVRTIDQGGAFWVQASVNGCSSTDTVVVTEIPLPLVQLGPDTGLCSSELLTLNVSVPGGSYLWNDGSTAAERSVPPGTWHVQVTVQECSARDTIQIGALPSPSLQLPQDTVLCTGTTWTIDVAQPGSSYLWTTGSTSSSVMVGDAGNYGVTVDRSGCTASASVEVGFVDLSQFDLGPDTTLCPGNTLELHVDIPGAAVLWQDGSTALQRTVASTGTFQATVTVGGCSAQSSVQVDFTPVPLVFLGPDRTLCVGDTVLLTIDPGQAQPVWSTGGNGNDLNVTSTGAYSVSLSLDGCTTADTVLLTFIPVINQLDLGPDREVCPERPVILNAMVPGAAYTWSNGSHQPTLAVTEPGTFSVAVTGPCINAADTIVILKGKCAPVVHIPNAFTPDGDEINDLFAPVVFEPVRSWTFLIFDRWGALIFTSEVPGGAWDGNVKGKEAPVGVYVWDLHYEAVTSGGVVQKHLRGSVVLVR